MKKIFCSILVFALLITMVTGCEKEKKADNNTTAAVVNTPKVETFNIYTINSDKSSIEPISVPKKKKITADYIVESVLDSFSEDGISVYSVEEKNNKVIVSFRSKEKPVVGCDDMIEGMVLECFSNSLLDNLDKCKKVIFRIDGNKPYKSKNFSFGLNEEFATK